MSEPPDVFINWRFWGNGWLATINMGDERAIFWHFPLSCELLAQIAHGPQFWWPHPVGGTAEANQVVRQLIAQYYATKEECP